RAGLDVVGWGGSCREWGGWTTLWMVFRSPKDPKRRQAAALQRGPSTDLDGSAGTRDNTITMKILHTADWHLGDRMGRIDRTADLRRAVERVAAYAEQQRVDVLLVAGDLFSELNRPDGLRDSIAHLQEVFNPFLVNGGTIVALTGNHDNEIFCQTLRHAMSLAAPAPGGSRGPVPSGRLYLAAGPTLLRLADTDGQQVQFILMPYPTPARYLDQPAQHYANLEEKNR